LTNTTQNNSNSILLDGNTTAEYLGSTPGLRMWQYEIIQPPKPQLQTRKGLNGFYDPSKEYKKTIIWQIRPHAPTKPLEGPIALYLTFYVPIPACTSAKNKRKMLLGEIKPNKRPDIDNFAYIVTNALKTIVYEDDGQICDMILSKRYGEIPKTVIKVCEI